MSLWIENNNDVWNWKKFQVTLINIFWITTKWLKSLVGISYNTSFIYLILLTHLTSEGYKKPVFLYIFLTFWIAIIATIIHIIP